MAEFAQRTGVNRELDDTKVYNMLMKIVEQCCAQELMQNKRQFTCKYRCVNMHAITKTAFVTALHLRLKAHLLKPADFTMQPTEENQHD